MLIADAEPADRQQAFADGRAVVLRLAEGLRRR
jgi:hypothetical protein